MKNNEEARRLLSWEEAQSFDRLAELYDRLGELSDDPVGAWLPSILPTTGKHALDLGCGAGRHAVLLAERFEQVDAVDLSAAMIRLARRKRHRDNITYLQADVPDLDGSYDLIVSSATLHHVADLPETLIRLKNLLAPGGRAVLVDVVSPWPANPRWWLLGGEVRRLARNLVRRGAAEAWEIFKLSTGPWLDHRVSDRYLSRTGFEQAYGDVFPGATFTPVGSHHAMLWENSSTERCSD